jgi:transcriptional regulator with XRE-family HTH domain
MNILASPVSTDRVDFEVLEESALAMAQSAIQNAMDASGLSQADIARGMERHRSFVSRMLSGSHNLTIKTMARSFAACGFEVRFGRVPIAWNWVETQAPSKPVELPAHAGSTMPVSLGRRA